MDGHKLHDMGRRMKQDVQIKLQQVAYDIVDGYETETTAETTIWAGKRSVKRNEFYQASQAGYRADAIFTIYAFEYNNEEQLICDGVVYDIVRTYQTTLDTLELTCQVREEK